MTREKIQVWKLGKENQGKPVKVELEAWPEEKVLEALLEKHSDLFGEPLLIVKKQETYQAVADLWAVDSECTPTVIELKRKDVTDQTIAQAIRYASNWSVKGNLDEFIKEANRYLQSKHGCNITEAFENLFGKPFDQDILRKNLEFPRIIVAAGEFDEELEQIALYLSKYDFMIEAFAFHRLVDAETKKVYLIVEKVISETVQKEMSESGKATRPTRQSLSPEEFLERLARCENGEPLETVYNKMEQEAYRLEFGKDSGPNTGSCSFYIKTRISSRVVCGINLSKGGYVYLNAPKKDVYDETIDGKFNERWIKNESEQAVWYQAKSYGDVSRILNDIEWFLNFYREKLGH